MSILRKCLAPVVAAWVVFAALVLSSPSGTGLPRVPRRPLLVVLRMRSETRTS